MRYDVLLTAGAESDLNAIHAYIRHAEGQRPADKILTRLLELSERLRSNPRRGTYPRELSEIGVHEYRQLNMRPYRIIYRIVDSNVIIMLIADGRRDMQALLSRRLLLRAH